MSYYLAIIALGLFLYLSKHWAAKDAAQVCTGFFIVLTLFFTALNYEFTTSKMKVDQRAAKDLLTFNTATEWHKSPIKDYQKISIEFENKFINGGSKRDVNAFEDYINDPSNLEFKESLKGILNYLETVSIGVFKGLIDKSFMKEFYRFIFQIYYTDYIFYIDAQRVIKNNTKLWVNFTTLAEEWNPTMKEEMKNTSLKSTIII